MIDPSPFQPRMEFDLEDIRGSIKWDGVISPITVRKKGKRFELIDGERRVRATREEGLKAIPYVLVDVDDDTAMAMIWSVNIERKDYNLREKVRYAMILQKKGLNIEAIANKMRYSRAMIYDFLNVNKLPEKYQEYLWENKFGIGHLNEIQPMFNGSSVNIHTILKHLGGTVLTRYQAVFILFLF